MAAAVAARMECSVVVVGDAKIGKTALIRSLTHNEFTEVGTILPHSPFTPMNVPSALQQNGFKWTLAVGNNRAYQPVSAVNILLEPG